MVAATHTERLTYSIEEAAAVLGMSKWSAYRLAKTGELPTVRLGGKLYVPKAQLANLLAEPMTWERRSAGGRRLARGAD